MRSRLAVLERLFLCALLGAGCAHTRAEPHDTPFMSTRLNADPNGVSYGIEYRGAGRARFSDSFDLYGAEYDPGYSIAIAPLFELHEPLHSENFLPSQYWRARVSLAQGYGWTFPNLRLRLYGALTHESDHETSHAFSRPGFMALNDVAVRLLVAGRASAVAWYASADAQLYLLSCTDPNRQCKNFEGDTSFGGQVQAGLHVPAWTFWRLTPFSAISVTGILGNGQVCSERRLLGRLGLYIKLGDSVLSLFALGSVGNDVGIVRDRTLNVFGGGLAFTR
jgi:hypothetical protein